jgi:adenosyl cobinamide kinase/adenosyl cobinamide phosphate guanylyltransferase
MLAQSRKTDWKTLEETMDAFHQAIDEFDEEVLIALIQKLVPEMTQKDRAKEGTAATVTKIKEITGE